MALTMGSIIFIVPNIIIDCFKTDSTSNIFIDTATYYSGVKLLIFDYAAYLVSSLVKNFLILNSSN